MQYDVDLGEFVSGTPYYEHDWFPHFKQHILLSHQVIENLSSAPITAFFAYIKVKRFFLAPEITCPDLICTLSTAVMDVDPDADSITWSLTPSNLFTGSLTSTGKTANITAVGTNGQGKITYTFKMPSNEIFTAEKTFWVGTYSSSNYPVSGPSTAQCQQYVYYSIPQLVGVTSINWVWPGSWTYISGQNTWSLALKTGNSGSGGIVGVQATNSCGPSGSYYTKYTAVNGICGYSLVLTPNPATTETTLSIESTNPEVVFDENQEWEMKVYDAFQTLKMKKEKLKGKEMKIQASGWKVGVYIVRVKYKEEVLTEQLVVKQ